MPRKKGTPAANRKYEGPCPQHEVVNFRCLHCKALYRREMSKSQIQVVRGNEVHNGIGLQPWDARVHAATIRKWFRERILHEYETLKKT